MFLQDYFNVTLLCTSQSFKWYIPFKVSNQYSVYVSPISTICPLHICLPYVLNLIIQLSQESVTTLNFCNSALQTAFGRIKLW
jgi:hypothetical protein